MGRHTLNITDETFERLKKHGTGFAGSELGTPDKLINRLLDAYENDDEIRTRLDTVDVPGWDEDGFHVRLETDAGTIDIRITDTETARALHAGLEPLHSWVAEHDHELAAYLVASPAERSRVLGRALELDDPDAYEERAEALRAGADHARKSELENGDS